MNNQVPIDLNLILQTTMSLFQNINIYDEVLDENQAREALYRNQESPTIQVEAKEINVIQSHPVSSLNCVSLRFCICLYPFSSSRFVICITIFLKVLTQEENPLNPIWWPSILSRIQNRSPSSTTTKNTSPKGTTTKKIIGPKRKLQVSIYFTNSTRLPNAPYYVCVLNVFCILQVKRPTSTNVQQTDLAIIPYRPT